MILSNAQSTKLVFAEVTCKRGLGTATYAATARSPSVKNRIVISFLGLEAFRLANFPYFLR